MMKASPYILTSAIGAGCCAAGVAAHLGGIDMAVARTVWSLFDGQFPRNQWFLQAVMHEGMRTLTTLTLTGAVLLALLMRWRRFASLDPVRLQVFAVTAVAFVGGIAALKAHTTFACPWALGQFGGTRAWLDYADVFNVAQYGKGRCFPAGHSSGGYAWLGLAFAFATTRQELWRRMAVLIWPGVVLSCAQILRGAHFLSHELTTLGLALLVFSAMGALLTHHAVRRAA